MKPGDINRTIIELSTNLRVFEKSVIATDRALANAPEFKLVVKQVNELAATVAKDGISTVAQGATILQLCEGYAGVIKLLRTIYHPVETGKPSHFRDQRR